MGLADTELDDYISRAQKEIANQKLLQDAQEALDAHNLASAFDSAGKVPSGQPACPTRPTTSRRR